MRNFIDALSRRWLLTALLVVSLAGLPGLAGAALKISTKAAPAPASAPAAEPAAQAASPAPAPAAAPEPPPAPAKAEAPAPAPAPAAAPAPAPVAEPEKASAPAVKEEAAPAAAETAPAAAPVEEAAPEASSVAEESLADPATPVPLEVSTDPQGAKVFIDGEEYGVTPIVIEGLSKTPHELVLYHPTLGAFSKKIETGGGKISIKLSGAGQTVGVAGFVNVTTNPGNARIDIDGKNMGLSPMKVPVSAGRHTILLSKPGYVDKEISVTVSEKGSVDIKETLKEKAGALLVIATPPDAEVFLDGVSVGKAQGPIRISDIAPGNHEVRVEKPGYVAWKRDNVVVSREKTETVLAALHPQQNETSVRVYTEPEGARVWLDGKEVGIAGPEGLGFVTTKGAHTLKMELNPAQNPGYRPLRVSANFEEDNVDFKGVPFKLPAIDEAFIFAQQLYERGEAEQAISYLDKVAKDQPSYPDSRVLMIEILKDLNRVSEIPAEFEKLFEREMFKRNPVLNLSMGYWSIKAAAKASSSEAPKVLEKALEALDRSAESMDYFPAAQRQVLALKVHFYAALAAETLFDLTGDKKYVKKGAQSWELFFGRLKSGEETLGDEWVEKAKKHQTNLLYLEKKLGG